MIRWPSYPAHEAFYAPAKPSSALWRLVLGVVLAFAGYIAFGRLFFELLWQWCQTSNPDFYDAVFVGRTPGALLVMLGTFAFITVATGISVRLVHRRSFRSLFGALPLAVRQFGGVFAASLVLGIVLFVLPPWSMGAPLTPNLALGVWVALLPASVLAILVQTSAEEIFFRGYLQQQLAARFRSPLIWMLLPSAFFAAGHYMPEEAGSNAIAVSVWAGVFGLLMADITARAGTLGPAIALHFYTNLSAFLVVSMQGDLSGLALYLAPFGLEDEAALRAWLPVDFAHMIVVWLVARLVIRR